MPGRDGSETLAFQRYLPGLVGGQTGRGRPFSRGARFTNWTRASDTHDGSALPRPASRRNSDRILVDCGHRSTGTWKAVARGSVRQPESNRQRGRECLQAGHASRSSPRGSRPAGALGVTREGRITTSVGSTRTTTAAATAPTTARRDHSRLTRSWRTSAQRSSNRSAPR